MKLRISLVGSKVIVEADYFVREGDYFNFYRTTNIENVLNLNAYHPGLYQKKVFSIKAEEVKSVKEDR